MTPLLGMLGANEIVVLMFSLVVPIFFYWLGKRSGYRKGQLDMYKERERRDTK